ncbi:chorismate mutase [Ureibacillus sp. FSL K6-8385]|uniref:chorismate mutase n=1 Tax=Ureibacillus terrenus TaxID=118246 RepID=A0A540V6H8_9BACL|nr:chorismate mutase [Ureibacillus terrenus]MED3660634.1 chorismate mutase [Ureibacillus terrenus]MED3762754.1 chorismate mutase [Ureibacillus terrenus]TQE92374.1 chorismate mutase [Ureibacillus terrenus]
MIRGIRGAITIKSNTPEVIYSETERLVKEMARANNIAPEDIASVIVTTTPDINAAFPAKAVRSIEGWKFVPTMCTHEMDVPGALPLCIRVLMHVNTTVPQKDIHHIYLNDAVKLRPDLVREKR